MTELLCKEEVYAIVGVAMEVYNVLGPGFLNRCINVQRRLRPQRGKCLLRRKESWSSTTKDGR
jgi:hypothetical protein